ncbi:MAG: hypothetical protein GY842_02865, partial [bacterium]|nr:hypothetical protein [bacterium]
MKVRAIIGAAAAAVLGAVVWAVITSATGYEVGIVAWGIGLAVGIGAKAFGGEGQVLGVVCAALALGSIFVGKVVAVQHVTEGQISGLMEAALDESFYEEVRQDAQHFAELESDEDYAE